MNREDIIQMARDAGFEPDSYQGWLGIEDIERFAALVAAAEREACAKVLESVSNAPDMQRYAAAIRARGCTL